MAKPKPLDVKGHYRILKVATDAGVEEIRLATAMAKQNAAGPYLRKIEEAWETLSVAERREAYDRMGLDRPNPLKSPYTLAACVALLIGAFVWLYLPEIRMRSKTFAAGQTLIEVHTGREFGQVLERSTSHLFPQGVRAPAYLVRMAAGGDRWLPAADLQATCDAR
jgi:curved DNA-binding protein CbpA